MKKNSLILSAIILIHGFGADLSASPQRQNIRKWSKSTEGKKAQMAGAGFMALPSANRDAVKVEEKADAKKEVKQEAEKK